MKSSVSSNFNALYLEKPTTLKPWKLWSNVFGLAFSFGIFPLVMLLFMYIIAPAWICMCIVKMNLGFLGFGTSPQQPRYWKRNTLLQSPLSRHGLSAMPSSRDQPACNAREQQQWKFHARCGPFSKFNLLYQSGGLLVVWGVEMGCKIISQKDLSQANKKTWLTLWTWEGGFIKICWLSKMFAICLFCIRWIMRTKEHVQVFLLLVVSWCRKQLLYDKRSCFFHSRSWWWWYVVRVSKKYRL